MHEGIEDQTLDLAIPMIARFEGCRLKAYPDPGTGGEPWTIGYGATYYEDGTKVRAGDEITQEHAEKLLRAHVGHFMHEVLAMVNVDVNPHQAAALVSFAYNVGTHALRHSTLLKKLNAGDYHGASREFMRWTHAGGKTLAGLVNRREAEQEEFLV